MTEGSEATTVLHAVETSGQWIGPPERPLMSWLTTPVEGPASVGVLVVPPVGYEYWNSHRTLRTLAERLAEGGCRVLRFDLDGLGDSAGDQWDASRLEAWRGSVDPASQMVDLGRGTFFVKCSVGDRVTTQKVANAGSF